MPRPDAPGHPTAGAVDHALLFRSLPTSYMVMDRDLVYVDVTDSYCATTGRTREELIGTYVFDAFPPTEDALDDDGVSRVQRSFERARDTGRPDTMPLQKYDIPDPATGGMSERWWSLISVPILDEHGEVVLIAQRAEDVTDWARERESGREAAERTAELDRRVQEVEADLYARARELAAAVAAKEVAAARLASLATVALALAAAETVEDLSRIVFGSGLAVLGADGGAVSVRDDDDGVLRLAVSDTLGAHVQQVYGELSLDSPFPAAHVARTGAVLLLPTREAVVGWSPLTAALHEATRRPAWATLPLKAKDRLLGALMISWQEERDFAPDELELMEGFAAQVSQALLRIQAIEAERRAARAAARLSETLQRSLLTEPPEVDGLSVAVRYQPAAQDAQVGGDWYDVVVGHDGSALLVVGDVSGHDRTAAAAMGQFRNLLRGIAFDSSDGPAALLGRLDRAASALALDALATAVIGRLTVTDQGAVLRWSNAGHLPPVLLDAEGERHVLGTDSDLLLGLDPWAPRTEHEVLLAPGSTLVLFTDGLVERRDDSIDAGIRRVTDALCAAGADGDVEAVADAVVACAQGVNDDDIAVLVVHVRDPAQASGGVAEAVARTTSVTLPPEPTSPGEARRLLRRVLLDAGREEWLDAAELACSEVVSNAVLHAHTDLDLTVAVEPDRVRVEVRDRSPALPVQRQYGGQATTGRGMALVAALTDAHGVRDAGPDGKTVWFTVSGGLPDVDEDALLAAWDDDGFETPEPAPGAVVRLVSMPPALWLAARQHHDALLRELVLYLAEHRVAAAAEGADGPAVDLAAADRARGLISTAVVAELERGAHRGAREAAPGLDGAGHHAPPAVRGSLAPSPAALDLEVRVPVDLGPAFAALQDTLDVAERLAASGALLARPGLPEVVAVRDWACDQVTAQLAGAPPVPWPGTAQERFELATDGPAGSGTGAFDLEAVRGSDRCVVAGDDANRIVAVSRPLADLLGWAPEELEGRRVVAIVPPALREAHVAGFTRHLATGEHHVVDVPLTLPVLHRDGHEVMCGFLLQRAPGTDRVVHLAWFDPPPTP